MTLDQGWALIAAALIGFGSGVAILWMQSQALSRRSRDDARDHAYSRLLSSSLLVLHLADTLRQTIDQRSGWLNQFLSTGKNIEPIDVYEWLRREFQPVYEAHARIFIVGSPEATALADKLLSSCGEVVGFSGSERSGGGMLGKLTGGKWTDDQKSKWDNANTTTRDLRKELAALARRESGLKALNRGLREDGNEKEKE